MILTRLSWILRGQSGTIQTVSLSAKMVGLVLFLVKEIIRLVTVLDWNLLLKACPVRIFGVCNWRGRKMGGR